MLPSAYPYQLCLTPCPQNRGRITIQKPSFLLGALGALAVKCVSLRLLCESL
jgi:hypothetical protein